MPVLTIATMAAGDPMGAQVYEREVTRRAAPALGTDWRVVDLTVRSLRSELAGRRRIPLGALRQAPAVARSMAGRVLYPRGSVVHRMGLELPPGPGANSVTLHDLVAWDFDDESAPVRAAAAELRAADAVICVSEFTAAQAVRRFGIREPFVVPNGVDQAFLDATPAPGARLQALGIDGRFVLVAGGATRRKNLAALARAWPIVRQRSPELQLALTGSPDPRRTALFAALPGTVLLGRLAAADLPGVMAAASAVVVPSLVEGFGLPALEAMAAGSPVVAARTSSLPEVVGDAGFLVEPTPEALAGGILDAVSDDDQVRQLVRVARRRAAQYTWQRSARGHAEVWRSLA